jgi:hypothetical protein
MVATNVVADDAHRMMRLAIWVHSERQELAGVAPLPE